MKALYFKSTLLISALLITGFFIPQTTKAHCDSMDGPVVLAAQKALETGNVNLVLIWVNEDQEEQIRETFTKTRNVRDHGENVRQVADTWFFETLVRLHRESEGASYTGLKPAGTSTGPVIPATDQALETGSARELRDLIVNAFEQQLHIHFEKALRARDFDSDNVEAGREYVHNYVELLHFVKPVYDMLDAEERPAHNHGH